MKIENDKCSICDEDTEFKCCECEEPTCFNHLQPHTYMNPCEMTICKECFLEKRDSRDEWLEIIENENRE